MRFGFVVLACCLGTPFAASGQDYGIDLVTGFGVDSIWDGSNPDSIYVISDTTVTKLKDCLAHRGLSSGESAVCLVLASGDVDLRSGATGTHADSVTADTDSTIVLAMGSKHGYRLKRDSGARTFIITGAHHVMLLGTMHYVARGDTAVACTQQDNISINNASHVVVSWITALGTCDEVLELAPAGTNNVIQFVTIFRTFLGAVYADHPASFLCDRDTDETANRITSTQMLYIFPGQRLPRNERCSLHQDISTIQYDQDGRKKVIGAAEAQMDVIHFYSKSGLNEDEPTCLIQVQTTSFPADTVDLYVEDLWSDPYSDTVSTVVSDKEYVLQQGCGAVADSLAHITRTTKISAGANAPLNAVAEIDTDSLEVLLGVDNYWGAEFYIDTLGQPQAREHNPLPDTLLYDARNRTRHHTVGSNGDWPDDENGYASFDAPTYENVSGIGCADTDSDYICDAGEQRIEGNLTSMSWSSDVDSNGWPDGMDFWTGGFNDRNASGGQQPNEGSRVYLLYWWTAVLLISVWVRHRLRMMRRAQQCARQPTGLLREIAVEIDEFYRENDKLYQRTRR